MLIVSKFRDYYDKIGASFGVDKTIVFNRRSYLTEKIKFMTPYGWYNFRTETKPKENEIFSVGLVVVGFCGKTYIGIAHRTTTIIKAEFNETQSHNDKFYWGKENIEKYLKRSLNKDEVNFINDFDESKKHIEIFVTLSAPIFTHVYPITHNPNTNSYFTEFFKSIEDTKDERGREITRQALAVNNNLSQLNFQSVVYPVQAFQEIQMFISGVLGVGEKPMIEISNNDKIVSQGFSLKTSFRKDTPPTRKQKVK